MMTGTNAKLGGGGLHHVAIRVLDFDASVAFYTGALGFVPTLSWGQGDERAVLLDTGDGSLLEIFAGGKERRPEGVYLHLALRTNACDAALEQARAAGAQVTMEPTSLPSGWRIAFFKGPDGEVVELLQESAA